MFCRLVSQSCFSFRPVYTAVNTTIRDTADWNTVTEPNEEKQQFHLGLSRT